MFLGFQSIQPFPCVYFFWGGVIYFFFQSVKSTAIFRGWQRRTSDISVGIWASHPRLFDLRTSKHAPSLRASPLKYRVNLITLSIIPWYVKKSPLINATSFKSKEHVELRQPSIYPLSIKERTHTPLSIYLAKCSINIKLISPLRVSITQTFFFFLNSLAV